MYWMKWVTSLLHDLSLRGTTPHEVEYTKLFRVKVRLYNTDGIVSNVQKHKDLVRLANLWCMCYCTSVLSQIMCVCAPISELCQISMWEAVTVFSPFASTVHTTTCVSLFHKLRPKAFTVTQKTLFCLRQFCWLQFLFVFSQFAER